MNLTQELKPFKKVNVSAHSQPVVKANSNASKPPRTRSRGVKVESTDELRITKNNSNGASEIDAFHYLAEEVDVFPNQGFNKPTIDVIAWNINGMRAMAKKNDLKELIHSKDPDIICFYELKCDKYSYISQNISKEFNFMEIYPYKYFSFSQIGGYSGVAVYSKIKPLNYEFNMGHPEIDKESRFIKLEFNTFHFISVYVPTSGENLKRLDYRIDIWDAHFRAYCARLRMSKPIVIAGDLNVAHNNIDIHNPKVSL